MINVNDFKNGQTINYADYTSLYEALGKWFKPTSAMVIIPIESMQSLVQIQYASPPVMVC